ncbi:hypothetical protein BB559_001973 [Furculomyces boomerangus]|uniref:DUF7082 domain-containing protein n=1 Tax=Furculomyces boomerangus TaxID=61424 RepID=A0A2T9YZ15_9FUNG|nr:hypothetical protein BB559_001973 [Furculomyces boomerangus]
MITVPYFDTTREPEKENTNFNNTKAIQHRNTDNVKEKDFTDCKDISFLSSGYTPNQNKGIITKPAFNTCLGLSTIPVMNGENTMKNGINNVNDPNNTSNYMLFLNGNNRYETSQDQYYRNFENQGQLEPITKNENEQKYMISNNQTEQKKNFDCSGNMVQNFLDIANSGTVGVNLGSNMLIDQLVYQNNANNKSQKNNNTGLGFGPGGMVASAIGNSHTNHNEINRLSQGLYQPAYGTETRKSSDQFQNIMIKSPMYNGMYGSMAFGGINNGILGGSTGSLLNRTNIVFEGNLETMVTGWTNEEMGCKRRLVQFWRRSEASNIVCSFKPIRTYERSPNNIVVSCIYWENKNDYFITSVDCIHLLESLIAVRFTVEEKNRIRRNLEGFRPLTASKCKADSSDFYKLIMSYPNPKPRNIEKDVKVFKWKNLSNALKKIIGKYTSSSRSGNKNIHQFQRQFNLGTFPISPLKDISESPLLTPEFRFANKINRDPKMKIENPYPFYEYSSFKNENFPGGNVYYGGKIVGGNNQYFGMMQNNTNFGSITDGSQESEGVPLIDRSKKRNYNETFEPIKGSENTQSTGIIGGMSTDNANIFEESLLNSNKSLVSGNPNVVNNTDYNFLFGDNKGLPFILSESSGMSKGYINNFNSIDGASDMKKLDMVVNDIGNIGINTGNESAQAIIDQVCGNYFVPSSSTDLANAIMTPPIASNFGERSGTENCKVFGNDSYSNSTKNNTTNNNGMDACNKNPQNIFQSTDINFNNVFMDGFGNSPMISYSTQTNANINEVENSNADSNTNLLDSTLFYFDQNQNQQAIKNENRGLGIGNCISNSNNTHLMVNGEIGMTYNSTSNENNKASSTNFTSIADQQSLNKISNNSLNIFDTGNDNWGLQAHPCESSSESIMTSIGEICKESSSILSHYELYQGNTLGVPEKIGNYHQNGYILNDNAAELKQNENSPIFYGNLVEGQNGKVYYKETF